jgi:hypothetical protein
MKTINKGSRKKRRTCTIPDQELNPARMCLKKSSMKTPFAGRRRKKGNTKASHYSSGNLEEKIKVEVRSRSRKKSTKYLASNKRETAQINSYPRRDTYFPPPALNAVR